NLANAVVRGIGEIQIAGRIERQRSVISIVKQSRGERAVDIPLASSGECADRAIGREFADDRILPVGDIEIAGAIEGQTRGTTERSECAGASITGARGDSVSRDHVEGAIRGEAHHHVVIRIGYIDLALAVDGEPGDVAERGLYGAFAIAV